MVVDLVRTLLPDLKRLRELIKVSKTNDGDGTESCVTTGIPVLRVIGSNISDRHCD